MKKATILGAALLMMMMPSLGLAEEGTKNTNELGIKVGTEVYGEDISKLSKEELQYVPKGWRDGKVESEHKNDETNQRSLLRTVYPDVNSYIKRKGFSTAAIKRNHNNEFEKFSYRNGLGAVEGVVAHETANNSSNIWQEIAYMSRNHKNAFVHAFVDDSNVIEIHPLDLGAWGAGRFGNERFAHVELVRVHSFSDFAKSINNYSEYLATILYEYGLGVTSAESNGKGTLWSHNAVSRHLGGTTHTDPHGYFARWGYHWNDFVDLVTEKYNNKVKEAKQNTSKLGHIKTSKVRIYESPMNTKNYKKAGNKNTREVFYIKAEAVHKNERFYLISRHPSSRTGTVGWVRSKDMNVHIHKGIDKKSRVFEIVGTGKAYDKAWGGSKNLEYNLSKLSGRTFRVNLTEAVGKNKWYRGKIKGSNKNVWIHSSYLGNGYKTSKLGHIRHSDVNVYKSPTKDSRYTKAGNKMTHAVYYIKKQAEVGNDMYYLLSSQPSSTKGTIGWVKAQDMSTHKHTGMDKKKKTMYIKGSGKSYNKAWGGNKDLVYNDMTKYAGQPFFVHLTEKVGNNVWYRGELNGEIVWLHSSYVMKNIKTHKTSKLGHLRLNAQVYSRPGDQTTSTNARDSYYNSVYYIKKQADVNNQIYYLISTKPSSVEGTLGWVKSQDLSLHSHISVNKDSKTFYIKGKGKAYNKAWGGSKDIVYKDMKEYKNQPFRIHLTEKVGQNTWYRGILNGETVWLHSSYLLNSISMENTSKTSRLGHLHSNAMVYNDINKQSSSFSAANNGLLNAVYYIKEKADIKGQTFYLISRKPSNTTGLVGWVNSEEMTTHTHIGFERQNKTLKIKGSGRAYSKAWGGEKDLIYDMKNFKGEDFNIHLTEKVGNNIWHRGNLGGKTVWLHNAYLK